MNQTAAKTSPSRPSDRTASRAPKTTSSRNNRGFTLIEILIVLGIITLVISLGLPAIERVTYLRVNSTTRKFVGVIRTIRNDAILLNTVHRLALDLEKNEWWVESQRQFKLLTEVTEVPDKKKKKSSDEPEPSNFEYATKYSKKPMPLPGGVVFQGLLKEAEGFRKEGVVYIHFFPNGFNDQAIIYLNKEGAESGGYSMKVRPTSGRVEVVGGKVQNFN